MPKGPFSHTHKAKVTVSFLPQRWFRKIAMNQQYVNQKGASLEQPRKNNVGLFLRSFFCPIDVSFFFFLLCISTTLS